MPNYEFDVLIHGKSTTKYAHEGRYYLEGRPNTEFTLLVRNNTPTRVLTVITVDGLSVMDGKKGSLDGNGYVVDPFQTLKIPGWRLDDDDVAKFIFAGKGKSYAAKKGNSRNVGVIGCAIFNEDASLTSFTVICDSNHGSILRGGVITHTGDSIPGWCTTTSGEVPCSYDDAGSSVYSVSDCSVEGEEPTSGSVYSSNVVGTPERTARRVSTKKMATQNIGTGFGEKVSHGVTEVSFNKKDRPTEVFAIHYDDRKGLESRGIDLNRKVHVANPFPKDAEKGCQPPADWNS